MGSKRRKSARPPVQIRTRLVEWGPRGTVIGHANDRRLLIGRGLPGELVDVTVRPGKSGWTGSVDGVVEASSLRVDAPCRHYAAGCGGCQWQHVAYQAQVETKRQLVNDAMAAHDVAARVQESIAMDDPWRYRHTASIAIGWEAGFRPRGRRGIVEIRDCPISHWLIGEFASDLNTLLRAGHLPNYHGKVWVDCTVVGTRDSPGLQVLIQGIAGLSEQSHPELCQVADTLDALPAVRSVAYRERSGEPRTLIGPLESEIAVGGRMFWHPAGSFFQSNVQMLQRVITRMKARVSETPTRMAADIYGGVGTLGLPLADLVDHMTLVELDPFAVEAARHTALTWGRNNVDFVSRHAERAIPDLPPLDLAIVDPPRSGLQRVVTSALASAEIPLLLYLSCSPTSLAADLKILCATGYEIESLAMYDFYPQTYHVECLAILTK